MMRKIVIARSVTTKQSQGQPKLSSPRKPAALPLCRRESINCWIPVFTGMTACLLVSMLAFADETVKPSAFAQPKAATPRAGTVPATGLVIPAKAGIQGTVPSREEVNSKSTLPPAGPAAAPPTDYKVGVDDVLDIAVLQPEQMSLTVTVSPGGSITFPYIGKVDVKGKTPAEVQYEMQRRLADGYLKYPVVSVAVKESRSNKFYVYGEVLKPGTYFLGDNMTVLKAVSTAGGFTKYGSSSRVKVLRPRAGAAGYNTIKVNMKLIMNGLANDVVLEPGDIVQVEEGVF